MGRTDPALMQSVSIPFTGDEQSGAASSAAPLSDIIRSSLHQAGRNPVAAVSFLITYYDNNIIFRCYLFLVLQRLVPFQPFQLLPKIFPTEIYFRLTTYSPVHLKKRISMDVIHIDL
ncbi:hypothetical protein, partial [Victivallis vadensis]|uniref:hypothetical protein n=1 Tax=Victivallis vadensis TaxID=172901 RepID=UPI003AF67B50